MSGKIILNLAVSLDGFISDKEGGYEWIAGQGGSTIDSEEGFDFEGFVRSIDVVLMGHNCYLQEMHKPYIGSKKVYVATSNTDKSEEGVEFIGNNIAKTIKGEAELGKNVFLFGGGVVIDQFIKADLIDEYIIGVIPVILGDGRPLFLGGNPFLKLNLESIDSDDGVAMLRYTRRK